MEAKIFILVMLARTSTASTSSFCVQIGGENPDVSYFEKPVCIIYCICVLLFDRCARTACSRLLPSLAVCACACVCLWVCV